MCRRSSIVISDFPVLTNFGVALALAMGMAALTTFVLIPAIALALARREDSLSDAVSRPFSETHTG